MKADSHRLKDCEISNSTQKITISHQLLQEKLPQDKQTPILNSMKHVLLYTDTPLTGGAELQMFLLAKFLNKENFTPILACSNYQALDKWCENFKREGIQIIRLDVKSKHDPRHLKLLKQIIQQEKIDILHAHIWNPASGRYAYMAAKSTKIPLITTEHDPFKLSAIKDLFKKYQLKTVSKIITVSQENAKTLKSLYPNQANKIQTIHNGIDTTWWQSQLLRFTDGDYQEIKEKIFHARLNTLIITCIAELHERKGQKYLIQAIAEITNQFPNTKLVLVGDGPDKENLYDLVKKMDLQRHVTFTGKSKEIPAILKASDIFVLPSRREAFGLVNLEAMMIPLPIVASNVGGIPEVVEDGKTGILVKPENHTELAKALKILIENEKIREGLAEAGKKRVMENFSAKKMAQEYEKVYQNI